MASGSSPKALHRKKAEPIGWDYENVKAREEPISDTWFFVPWENTEVLQDPHAMPAAGTPPKLLLREIRDLEDQYRGSGVITSSVSGRIIGCYKVYKDTEAGYNDKMQVQITRNDIDQAVTEGLELMSIAAPLTQQQTAKLDEINEELAEGPIELRRYNGLLLDPRPQWIALHKPEVFQVHPAMANQLLHRYGDQYLSLEYKIVRAMGDAFDPKKDYPIYRQKELGVKVEAGDNDE